jgi:excisionase family DNA binding protein
MRPNARAAPRGGGHERRAPMAEFLTIDDAADRLGVHRATITRKIQRGELVGYVGADNRRKYVKATDVNRIGAFRPIPRVLEPAETPRLAS